MKFIKEWGIFILIILALLLSRVFIWSTASVDGDSMDPTLANGQGLVATKVGAINRFDIVIAKETNPSLDVVKRVIGLPGDTITFDHDKLTINGKSCNEPYLANYQQQYKDGTLAATYAKIPSSGGYDISGFESLARTSKAFTVLPQLGQQTAYPTFQIGTTIAQYAKKATQINTSSESTAGATTFTIKVPAGEYFLMGDDRVISADSRSVGPFKRSDIVGKVVFRYWPLNKISLIN